VSHSNDALVTAMGNLNIGAKLYDYALLMRWDKPIGALLLLWPTLWALWLAGEGQPQQSIVIIFLAGVWLMRSAGCIVNDIADRDFDPHVERTRDRPLAAGRVSLRQALLLFCIVSLIAFALVLLLNRLTLWLALIGVVLTISYPFMKRFHHLPQGHLGLAFGWGIPMAYAALTGSVPFAAWLLFIANIAWVLVYDTVYAMSDREDDLKIGVKSSAILFGDYDTRMVGLFQTLTLVLMVAVGILNEMNAIYYFSLLFGAWFFLYQQYLIHDRDRYRCFRAFLNNNGFGLTIFCGIVLNYLP
jgi:4-hydroxybenzoate polyprenyltransferase